MNTPVPFVSCDDTLRYRLVAQKILSQEDVRVVTEITALVSTANSDQGRLERRIRQALNNFIASDWVFSTVHRLGEAVGFERVSLRAWARVPHGEIYNLEERARRASAEGLSLGKPELDYSLPSARVNEIVQTLRRESIEAVKRHCEEFAQQTGRAWRIGDIEFGVTGSRAQRTGKGAYRSTSDDADLMLLNTAFESDEEETGITGSERIALITSVTLRARMPD
jgi:hypothetical protein